MPQETPYVTMQKNGKVFDVPRENLFKAKAMGWSEVKDVKPTVFEDESVLKKVGRGAALGAFSGAGIAETQTPVKDTLKNLMNQAGEWLAPWKHPLTAESWKRSAAANPAVAIPTALAKGGTDVIGDVNPVIDNLFRFLSNKTGGKKYDYKPVDIEKTSHDVASLATQVAMLKGGKKAAETPIGESAIARGSKNIAGAVPKAQMAVEKFVHSGGLAAQSHIQNAVDLAKKQVSSIADSVSNTIDQAHPEGVVDAKAITEGIEDDLKQVVKLPEMKRPPALARLAVPEAKGGISTGPRIGGGHLDLSTPQGLKMFRALKEQGALNPREIERMEGPAQEGKWGFEEAKQLRTELGYNLDKIHGPMRAAANMAYKRLTEGLQKAAVEADKEISATGQKSNLLKQWEYYNALHKALQTRLSGKLGKILEAETGKDVTEKLTSDPAFRWELLDDFKKYGLDVEAIESYAKYAKKAEYYLKPGIMRHWPAAIAAGYAGRIIGLPWAEAAIAGGYGTPLWRLFKEAHTARTSTFGELGEEAMRKRALPSMEEAPKEKP